MADSSVNKACFDASEVLGFTSKDIIIRHPIKKQVGYHGYTQCFVLVCAIYRQKNL